MNGGRVASIALSEWLVKVLFVCCGIMHYMLLLLLLFAVVPCAATNSDGLIAQYLLQLHAEITVKIDTIVNHKRENVISLDSWKEGRQWIVTVDEFRISQQVNEAMIVIGEKTVDLRWSATTFNGFDLHSLWNGTGSINLVMPVGHDRSKILMVALWEQTASLERLFLAKTFVHIHPHQPVIQAHLQAQTVLRSNSSETIPLSTTDFWSTAYIIYVISYTGMILLIPFLCIGFVATFREGDLPQANARGCQPVGQQDEVDLLQVDDHGSYYTREYGYNKDDDVDRQQDDDDYDQQEVDDDEQQFEEGCAHATIRAYAARADNNLSDNCGVPYDFASEGEDWSPPAIERRIVDDCNFLRAMELFDDTYSQVGSPRTGLIFTASLHPPPLQRRPRTNQTESLLFNTGALPLGDATALSARSVNPMTSNIGPCAEAPFVISNCPDSNIACALQEINSDAQTEIDTTSAHSAAHTDLRTLKDVTCAEPSSLGFSDPCTGAVTEHAAASASNLSIEKTAERGSQKFSLDAQFAGADTNAHCALYSNLLSHQDVTCASNDPSTETVGTFTKALPIAGEIKNGWAYETDVPLKGLVIDDAFHFKGTAKNHGSVAQEPLGALDEMPEKNLDSQLHMVTDFLSPLADATLGVGGSGDVVDAATLESPCLSPKSPKSLLFLSGINEATLSRSGMKGSGATFNAEGSHKEVNTFARTHQHDSSSRNVYMPREVGMRHCHGEVCGVGARENVLIKESAKDSKDEYNNNVEKPALTTERPLGPLAGLVNPRTSYDVTRAEPSLGVSDSSTGTVAEYAAASASDLSIKATTERGSLEFSLDAQFGGDDTNAHSILYSHPLSPHEVTYASIDPSTETDWTSAKALPSVGETQQGRACGADAPLAGRKTDDAAKFIGTAMKPSAMVVGSLGPLNDHTPWVSLDPQSRNMVTSAVSALTDATLDVGGRSDVVDATTIESPCMSPKRLQFQSGVNEAPLSRSKGRWATLNAEGSHSERISFARMHQHALCNVYTPREVDIRDCYEKACGAGACEKASMEESKKVLTIEFLGKAVKPILTTVRRLGPLHDQTPAKSHMVTASSPTQARSSAAATSVVGGSSVAVAIALESSCPSPKRRQFQSVLDGAISISHGIKRSWASFQEEEFFRKSNSTFAGTCHIASPFSKAYIRHVDTHDLHEDRIAQSVSLTNTGENYICAPETKSHKKNCDLGVSDAALNDGHNADDTPIAASAIDDPQEHQQSEAPDSSLCVMPESTNNSLVAMKESSVLLKPLETSSLDRNNVDFESGEHNWLRNLVDLPRNMRSPKLGRTFGIRKAKVGGSIQNDVAPLQCNRPGHSELTKTVGVSPDFSYVSTLPPDSNCSDEDCGNFRHITTEIEASFQDAELQGLTELSTMVDKLVFNGVDAHADDEHKPAYRNPATLQNIAIPAVTNDFSFNAESAESQQCIKSVDRGPSPKTMRSQSHSRSSDYGLLNEIDIYTVTVVRDDLGTSLGKLEKEHRSVGLSPTGSARSLKQNGASALAYRKPGRALGSLVDFTSSADPFPAEAVDTPGMYASLYKRGIPNSGESTENRHTEQDTERRNTSQLANFEPRSIVLKMKNLGTSVADSKRSWSNKLARSKKPVKPNDEQNFVQCVASHSRDRVLNCDRKSALGNKRLEDSVFPEVALSSSLLSAVECEKDSGWVFGGIGTESMPPKMRRKPPKSIHVKNRPLDVKPDDEGVRSSSNMKKSHWSLIDSSIATANRSLSESSRLTAPAIVDSVQKLLLLSNETIGTSSDEMTLQSSVINSGSARLSSAASAVPKARPRTSKKRSSAAALVTSQFAAEVDASALLAPNGSQDLPVSQDSHLKSDSDDVTLTGITVKRQKVER